MTFRRVLLLADMREAALELLDQFGKFLEFAPAPALRHAGKAGHALRHISLETDPLLLAVIADVDAGGGLLVDDVADSLVHFGGHLGGIEFFASLLAHQQFGQFLVARQAADMGGQNAVPAEDHCKWLPLRGFSGELCFALQPLVWGA